MNALQAVATSASTGHLKRPLLILDVDKESSMRHELAKWAKYPETFMDVIFVGKPDGDLESLFCEQDLIHDFLEHKLGKALDQAEKGMIEETLNEALKGDK